MDKLSLLVVVLTGLALGGCGKKPEAVEKTPAPPARTVSVSSESAPPPPPPAGVVAEATDPAAAPPAPAPEGTEFEGRDGFLKRVYSSDPQVAVGAMNQFIAGRNMTATTELKTFEQLVTEAGWPKAPKAPPGMRYILDPKTRLVVVIK